ncbi:MAG: terpene cyclase/mutase family protein [Planctomycetes bacterium]|nr:terpene cyclase/mutase family protein [Planctomycetota bacterium]
MNARRGESRVRRAAVALLALSLAALAEGARERSDAAPPGARDGVERERLTPDETQAAAALDDDPYRDREAVRAALERAVAFLAAQQALEPDGSFPPTGATQNAPVAVTALGALAYMATGSTLDRGPHGAELARAIDFLLAQCDRAATSRQLGYVHAGRDKLSRMHGHGFATLALCEAYTVAPRSPRGARLAEALPLAVRLIEASQGVEGGWYYDPVAGLEHEGSVTITLVQALRAAKDAGLHVDPQVIQRAVSYVERSQKEDGSFRYALGSEQSSVALTAAALSTLHASGRYHGREIVQGYDSIERELAARELAAKGGRGSLTRPDFPCYERLYLAQAYWQNPDRAVFDAWAARERRELLKQQREDGAWGGSPYGDCYATAVNVLVLALPDELLPAFQR